MLIYACIFNRLLHWIEETQQGRCLVQYDLEKMDSNVLRDNLVFSTLAENIEQNCIYIIINETQNISLSSVSVQENDDSNNLCASGMSFNSESQFISIYVCMYIHLFVYMYSLMCMYI